MDFYGTLIKAKEGNQKATEELLRLYHPLLLKESIVNGILDEDLYQELCIVFLSCIRQFKV